MTPRWFLRVLSRSGPPDLDEIIRNLKRKFGSLGGGASHGSGTGSEDPTRFLKTVGLVALVLVVLWVLSGCYKVDVPEEAVITRFGKYVETTKPGLNWHLPFPIERARIVNVAAVRTIEVGYNSAQQNSAQQSSVAEAEMITAEENIISVHFAVQYIIKDPVQYLFQSKDPDGSVLPAAESAIREWVGKSKIDFVLYEGRSEIAANTRALLQSILDRYGTGIQIQNVTMQNIQPPSKVQDAFDDAVRAVQDRDRQRNEGEAYANGVIPTARGKAARLSAEADAYSQSTVATAEGESSRFTNIQRAYSQAPQVTRQRMYLETLEKIYASHQKVLVDSQKPGNLLMLPLDKLLAARAGGAMTTPATPAADDNQQAATTTPNVQQPTNDDDRFNGLLRSRDRGSRP